MAKKNYVEYTKNGVIAKDLLGRKAGEKLLAENTFALNWNGKTVKMNGIFTLLSDIRYYSKPDSGTIYINIVNDNGDKFTSLPEENHHCGFTLITE